MCQSMNALNLAARKGIALILLTVNSDCELVGVADGEEMLFLRVSRAEIPGVL